MARGTRSDVCKLWLFPVAAALLGAWMTPLVYNAGKALAEVCGTKSTNGPLEWLAGICRGAALPDFYLAALVVATLVLVLPWIESLDAGRKHAGSRWRPGPWSLSLGDGRCASGSGQALRGYPRGLWHLCAGFLLAAGLALPLGLALVPAGFASMRAGEPGFTALFGSLLPVVLVLAGLQELLFRGLAMGIFLRAMKPSAAIAMSALYFAVVLSLIPAPGVTVADPEASGTGWEMLGNTLRHLAEGSGFVGRFLPLFALGALLSYARWRTASLWLPIGLHGGWLFARFALGRLLVQDSGSRSASSVEILSHGLVPIVALVAVAVFAHLLTSRHRNERPAGT